MSTYIPLPGGAPLPSLAGVTLPDDGDQPDVASVNVPMETLVDAVQYLQGKIDPANSVASGIEIIQRMAGVPVSGSNATVTGALSGDLFPSPCVSATDTFSFCYLLDLPHASGLRQIRVEWYEDTSALSTCTISVIRRDYATTIDVGDIADVPTETVISTATGTGTATSGGMKYLQATFSAHDIDRESACDYFVRVTGTTAVALDEVRFMPKVRQYIEFATLDQGAA